jgi:hypothetical protein
VLHNAAIGARLPLPRLHDVREPDPAVRQIVGGLKDERDVRSAIHLGKRLSPLANRLPVIPQETTCL